MPLDRLVLILVIVIAAAGATLGLGTLVATFFVLPVGGLALLIPAALVAFIVFRVVADRLGNRDDDHYDKMD